MNGDRPIPSDTIINAGSARVGEMFARKSFRYTVQLRTTTCQPSRSEIASSLIVRQLLSGQLQVNVFEIRRAAAAARARRLAAATR